MYSPRKTRRVDVSSCRMYSSRRSLQPRLLTTTQTEMKVCVGLISAPGIGHDEDEQQAGKKQRQPRDRELGLHQDHGRHDRGDLRSAQDHGWDDPGRRGGRGARDGAHRRIAH